jgi:peptidoglycan/LPS O-acetylase OafA/YrhL
MAAERSQTIDGLRGIAAMTVIVDHCLELSPLKHPNASLADPIAYVFNNDINLGRFGVIVFFFISGFLIPSSIGNQPKPLLSFFVGRFFRLYPLYWASMILALLAIPAVGNRMPTVGQAIANVTMFQMVLGFENILDPYWTLLIEHFFYILCVFFFLMGALRSTGRMRLIMLASGGFIILLAIILTIAPGMKHARQMAELMYAASWLFVMIVGHNVRIAQTRDTFRIPAYIPILFVVVFAFLCIARQMVGGYTVMLSPVSVFVSTTGAFFVFLLGLRMQLFGSRGFVYLGRISYGLYLFHGIALWIALALIGRPTGALSSALLLLLVIGLALVTSTLAFGFIEEPFIALGKMIRRRLGRRADVAREAEPLAPLSVATQDALRPFNRQSLPTES